MSTASFSLEEKAFSRLSQICTGPSIVAEKSASGLAFKRHLPAKLGRIHAVFYVFQFKQYHKSRKKQVLETHTSSDLQLEHKPVVYILAKRTRNGVRDAVSQYEESVPTEDRWTATSSIELGLLHKCRRIYSQCRQKAKIMSMSCYPNHYIAEAPFDDWLHESSLFAASSTASSADQNKLARV